MRSATLWLFFLAAMAIVGLVIGIVFAVREDGSDPTGDGTRHQDPVQEPEKDSGESDRGQTATVSKVALPAGASDSFGASLSARDGQLLVGDPGFGTSGAVWSLDRNGEWSKVGGLAKVGGNGAAIGSSLLADTDLFVAAPFFSDPRWPSHREGTVLHVDAEGTVSPIKVHDRKEKVTMARFGRLIAASEDSLFVVKRLKNSYQRIDVFDRSTLARTASLVPGEKELSEDNLLGFDLAVSAQTVAASDPQAEHTLIFSKDANGAWVLARTIKEAGMVPTAVDVSENRVAIGGKGSTLVVASDGDLKRMKVGGRAVRWRGDRLAVLDERGTVTILGSGLRRLVARTGDPRASELVWTSDAELWTLGEELYRIAINDV